MSESPTQPDRAAVQRIVDRIVTDPAYRRELVDDPHRALRLLGIEQEDDGPEVTGHLRMRDNCGLSCSAKSCVQTCNTGSTCGKSQFR